MKLPLLNLKSRKIINVLIEMKKIENDNKFFDTFELLLYDENNNKKRCEVKLNKPIKINKITITN